MIVGGFAIFVHSQSSITDQVTCRKSFALGIAFFEGDKSFPIIDRFHGVVDAFRVVALIREKGTSLQREDTVLHTDQGAVYSSRAFSRTHSNYNIIRSMSRAGTPTDNPIIESLNGWMKAELILDFGISKVFNLKKTLDQYVLYFNSERFAAALDYKTPIQYRTELGVLIL